MTSCCSRLIKKIILTLSLTHAAISHFSVARRTLAVVAAFGVLTDLRTGTPHLALIDVWRREETSGKVQERGQKVQFWPRLLFSADLKAGFAAWIFN